MRLSSRMVGIVALPSLVASVLLAANTAASAQPDLPPAPPSYAAQPAPANGALAQFRGTLDRYGSVFQHPRYGDVWAPAANVVGQGWAPYQGCHWAYDRQQQTWNYQDASEWGQIVHHYGRWAFDQSSGWLWIADANYGPGWVQWRNDAQSVSWSALLPDVDGGGAGPAWQSEATAVFNAECRQPQPPAATVYRAPAPVYTAPVVYRQQPYYQRPVYVYNNYQPYPYDRPRYDCWGYRCQDRWTKWDEWKWKQQHGDCSWGKCNDHGTGTNPWATNCSWGSPGCKDHTTNTNQWPPNTGSTTSNWPPKDGHCYGGGCNTSSNQWPPNTGSTTSNWPPKGTTGSTGWPPKGGSTTSQWPPQGGGSTTGQHCYGGNCGSTGGGSGGITWPEKVPGSTASKQWPPQGGGSTTSQWPPKGGSGGSQWPQTGSGHCYGGGCGTGSGTSPWKQQTTSVPSWQNRGPMQGSRVDGGPVRQTQMPTGQSQVGPRGGGQSRFTSMPATQGRFGGGGGMQGGGHRRI